MEATPEPHAPSWGGRDHQCNCNRWSSGEFAICNLGPCRVKLFVIVNEAHIITFRLCQRFIECRRFPGRPTNKYLIGRSRCFSMNI